ncbi:MAG: hypothetical protein HFJ72_03325 [Adlercreutzia sp.]|uniref:hypothetical protein n=1 Tax=uncultured Adlercreutzia sp. TaxID=875803 RepID=UPI00216F3AAC|nr:hypothetical protein [uncultured Adlercreutzia sp.]MCI8424682.1 hypothetical protein [Adlercreutzia sp.]
MTNNGKDSNWRTRLRAYFDEWSPYSWAPKDLTIRNPWILTALVTTVITSLMLVAVLAFGFPKALGFLIIKILDCGFWTAMFLYDLRKRKWVYALFSATFIFSAFLW